MKKQYIGVNIDDISQFGMLKLTFNVSLFNPNGPLDQFNEGSLSIKLRSGLNDEVKQVDWTLERMTQTTLWIQLKFDDPSKISIYS